MEPEDLIKKHTRLTKVQESVLYKIGLKTIKDVLFYFPNRYNESNSGKNINEINDGDKVTLHGRISNLKKEFSYRNKISMTRARFEDMTGTIQILWLHQPYISKMLHDGEEITITGIVSDKNGKRTIINPDILGNKNETGTNLFSENKDIKITQIPVYPETRGLSAKWFYYIIAKILANSTHKKIKETLPDELLKKYHLPKIEIALLWMHMPRDIKDAEAARKRFAFEEIITIEIERLRARIQYQGYGAYPIKDLTSEFVKSLPFKLTLGQTKVLKDVTQDCEKEIPMTRLLEGDVGSGKTAIAAALSYSAINTPSLEKKNEYLQVLYMAPTEILANQHFESFANMFGQYGKTIGLITSSGCKKFPAKSVSRKRLDIEWTPVSKSQMLKWAKDGSIDILIGTHSLMNKTVVMRHPALAIIDEQHRFGSKQRKALISRGGKAPHLLSMTATPIPRTLALTIYGDLDLSLLTDMPPGRKSVITKFISKGEREKMYEHVRSELKSGRQAYVICPRINEGEEKGIKKNSGGLRSVNEEAKILASKELKGYKIGVLHGKLKPNEKEDIMEDFLKHKIDVLVATSVVEVGVNIPNASVIIIEEAERFGVAQLHQLRGRVIRGNHQPYCYLTSNTESEKSGKRLTTLVETKNGFQLAEADLMERGPGHFAGIKQSGISDLAMEALRNIKLVEMAKKEAKAILENDPELKNYPEIKMRLEKMEKTMHFE
ncbi:hypothetical protein A3C57_00025 [Candidatus Nomurabacteria bacterium RIFCSPHIGHO2_02_FULL_33_12]|uniref:Probable DNA 3'-5' helicase RecG n=1 Tax=Candidatus Nomurabacteria bacterium RIFCSPLOWO2_01_FULL_33_17 TaxID=1801764 RepID=A0A1F6WQU0_9BACT|nr:MAG: hypothetical protein A3C57_00025 [Candidatus Nomurabacteria bacterium RIFCSPHIGHO2_02_FULL_33_12]OGI84241.1 MAG: hypothetical protein A2903_02415 [Candidatus Nomurabacteria bacterium RIFCSPLOWO2_01_FULL_33_17]